MVAVDVGVPDVAVGVLVGVVVEVGVLVEVNVAVAVGDAVGVGGAPPLTERPTVALPPEAFAVTVTPPGRIEVVLITSRA